jgi:hypothetical protein
LVECWCLCFCSFHTLYSPLLLSMAEGGTKRKRVSENNSPLNYSSAFGQVKK